MDILDTNILPNEPGKLSSYKYNSIGCRIGSVDDKPSKHQTMGTISIEEVLENLKSRKVKCDDREIWYKLNASIAYYLYLHQELIPKSWEGKEIVFIDTEFMSQNGTAYWKTLDYKLFFGYTVTGKRRNWGAGFQIGFRKKEKSKQSVSEQ